MSTANSTPENPISRLPIEVLQHIFELALEPLDETFSLLVFELSSVCTRWRAGVLSFPRLWTRLSIPVDRCSPGISEIARSFIQRSGTLPMEWYFGVRDKEDVPPTTLTHCTVDWTYLRLNAHRCKSLVFASAVAPAVFPMLFPTNTSTTFPALRHLHIAFGPHPNKYNDMPMGTLSAPMLQSVDTHHGMLTYNLLTSDSSYVQKITVKPSDGGAAILISACRFTLEHLEIDWDTVTSGFEIPHFVAEHFISTPALTHLSLRPNMAMDPCSLISVIHAPNLNKITLYFEGLVFFLGHLNALMRAAELFPAFRTLAVVGPHYSSGLEILLEQLAPITTLILEKMSSADAQKTLWRASNPRRCPNLQVVQLVDCEIEVHDDVFRQIQALRGQQGNDMQFVCGISH
jgi:hypothetical protein